MSAMALQAGRTTRAIKVPLRVLRQWHWIANDLSKGFGAGGPTVREMWPGTVEQFLPEYQANPKAYMRRYSL